MRRIINTDKTLGGIRSMNLSDITQARNVLAEHFETLERAPEPEVVEVPDAEASGPELGHETSAGLSRFAKFLKLASQNQGKQKSKQDLHREKAIQAYEMLQNYKDELPPG